VLKGSDFTAMESWAWERHFHFIALAVFFNSFGDHPKLLIRFEPFLFV
jgi:hypothetical protein